MAHGKVTQSELLSRFANLPDLLALARGIDPDDPYPEQQRIARLHREQGLPFRTTMPYRHVVRCPICGETTGEKHHELVNPATGDRATLKESELHRASVHGNPLPGPVIRFLDSL